MSGIKDKIRQASRPERTVTLCLNGAVVAEFEAAERELKEAARAGSDSLDGGPVREIAERIEALREQMAGSEVAFRLRAMSRNRWREFVAEHPPRQDDEGRIDPRDRAIGVNGDTFFDALVRASVVDPVLDGEDWTALIGDDGALTDAQFDALADAAWGLNRRDVDVPFSLAASKILNSARE